MSAKKTFAELSEDLGAELRLNAKDAERLKNPFLLISFESLLGEVELLLRDLKVREDRAPVMNSPESYLAKLEYKTREIILNGCFLDRAEDSALAREFLLWHEVFHYWVAQCVESAKTFILQWHLTEEELADLFALYAIAKRPKL